MFEKEAEEYAEGMAKYYESAHGSIPSQFEKYLRKAVEYGYNKANEWHYVKNGLSEKEKYVLIYTDLKNVYIARLVEDDYFITNKGGFVQTSAVIAWKEIILPKESE